MNLRSEVFGLEGAAQNRAFCDTVFLFGVPFWRRPRRSSGLDPRGIFATLLFLPTRQVNQSLTRAICSLAPNRSSSYLLRVTIVCYLIAKIEIHLP
jgi:hypothetical protein